MLLPTRLAVRFLVNVVVFGVVDKGTMSATVNVFFVATTTTTTMRWWDLSDSTDRP